MGAVVMKIQMSVVVETEIGSVTVTVEICVLIIDPCSKRDQGVVIMPPKIINNNNAFLLDHMFIHLHRGLRLLNISLGEHLGYQLLPPKFTKCHHLQLVPMHHKSILVLLHHHLDYKLLHLLDLALLHLII